MCVFALTFIVKRCIILLKGDWYSQRKVTFILCYYSNNANISYGIDVIDKERTVRQYANLSDNAEEIKKLVILCNSLDIEECHIDDIVEDFLTDFKTY